MKRIIFLFLLFTVFNLNAVLNAKGFKNLNDWQIVYSGKVNKELFKMQEDLLQIAAGSTGYIRTKKAFENYTLKVQWRWVNGKGNNGVLLHIQKPDNVWPKCYQAQLKADAAGDLICMNGFDAKECTDRVKFTVPKTSVSNEVAAGEWNKMKIVCTASSITVYVNGLKQNEITGLTKHSGFVGFQAEGQAIEFRKLKIKKIDEKDKK